MKNFKDYLKIINEFIDKNNSNNNNSNNNNNNSNHDELINESTNINDLPQPLSSADNIGAEL
jgi:hypothetical protein